MWNAINGNNQWYHEVKTGHELHNWAVVSPVDDGTDVQPYIWFGGDVETVTIDNVTGMIGATAQRYALSSTIFDKCEPVTIDNVLYWQEL